MAISPIDALSPLDGRYARKLAAVRYIFSEAGLMRERVRVECAWFLALAAGPAAHALAKLPRPARDLLAALSKDPSGTDAAAIKHIEARTNHDVKAVEIWLRNELKAQGAAAAELEWLHFGCTSEDINNLAYALMLKSARTTQLLPMLDTLGELLDALAHRHAATPMLARTHGQTASPTTVGKELANVAARLHAQRAGIARIAILGKMNGAVGNFNAHVAALPQVDWPGFSRTFLESLGLVANAHTTQIEPHDWIAEYCHALMRANTVLIDLARDLWSYISFGYFKQRVVEGEVGSSTMPHKVNPIDFENAEGNLGLANALLGHFADKLPLSRLQRDLTDSTVLRNLGVAIGHCVLSYGSLAAGLEKIELDPQRVAQDLDRAWEVLGEAVQTVMRAHGIPDAYERLRSFSRGRPIDREAMREFIAAAELPAEEKERLLCLEPKDYVGLAPALAKRTRGS
ncbi:MAG TPA: adenylosuccinate lyase [Steroidobacteraceae bacterium]|jgi:adenylosuccinate lyase|nr:adenylosuccinate lyase [Steroidobacteraceae bacterium]